LGGWSLATEVPVFKGTTADCFRADCGGPLGVGTDVIRLRVVVAAAAFGWYVVAIYLSSAKNN